MAYLTLRIDGGIPLHHVPRPGPRFWVSGNERAELALRQAIRVLTVHIYPRAAQSKQALDNVWLSACPTDRLVVQDQVRIGRGEVRLRKKEPLSLPQESRVMPPVPVLRLDPFPQLG